MVIAAAIFVQDLEIAGLVAGKHNRNAMNLRIREIPIIGPAGQIEDQLPAIGVCIFAQPHLGGVVDRQPEKIGSGDRGGEGTAHADAEVVPAILGIFGGRDQRSFIRVATEPGILDEFRNRIAPDAVPALHQQGAGNTLLPHWNRGGRSKVNDFHEIGEAVPIGIQMAATGAVERIEAARGFERIRQAVHILIVDGLNIAVQIFGSDDFGLGFTGASPPEGEVVYFT